MKKKIILTIAVLVAISLGVVGMSAFEAHVINVTAKIENALTLPLEASGMSFGTVFPEEVALQNMGIQLSSSFLTTDRVDDIEYMIRQKPKCGVPVVPATNPVSYSGFAQVTENSDGTFICPMVTVPGLTGPEQVQSVMLPLLCPYLSKHELDANGATTTNGIAAFHGPLTGWTMADTLATQVNGRLSKADGKTSTTWQLDLHAPCFKGMCAQDNVIPAAYEADPAFEHQMFGCDLWVEVRGVSLPGQPGTLTVTKIVSGSDKPVGDFPLFVDGISITSGQATTTSAGSHTVTETADPDYTAVFSGNCNSSGIVNVPAGGSATCTITNTYNVAPTGSLTVTKVVSGGSKPVADFPLFVDGMSVTSDIATTTSAGNHTVTETADPDYIAVFGGNCDINGIVNVPLGGSATCTITNTRKGTLTVNKILVPSSDPGLFNLQIGGATAGTGGNVGDGGTTGAINESGTVTVGETAGIATDLANYTTVIGGACAADGSVTVGPTDVKVCTITNTLKGGTIKVIKVVSNPGQLSGVHSANEFQMTINGINVDQNTASSVPAGTYTIGETNNFGYTTTFSDDCNGTNQVTVGPNQNKTCTVTNTVPFATLTVNKVVINNNGGNAATSSFPLFVDATSVTTEVPKNFAPGTYNVSESGLFGYSANIGGHCDLLGSVTLAAGETKTCIITNDDIPPSITLVKHVSGGIAAPDDFDVSIDHVVKTSGSSNPVIANTAHIIDEEALVSGYSFTSITGSSFLGVPCPAALEGTITLTPGDVVTCTITNTQ